MEHIVADSSADDTEESPAASNSPKEAITQPDGSATNSQAEEGCKCVLVCPIIHCQYLFSLIFHVSCVQWQRLEQILPPVTWLRN